MILEKFAFFGHFSVSYESKVLKIKHESTPCFAIASRFVTFFWYGHADLLVNKVLAEVQFTDRESALRQKKNAQEDIAFCHTIQSIRAKPKEHLNEQMAFNRESTFAERNLSGSTNHILQERKIIKRHTCKSQTLKVEYKTWARPAGVVLGLSTLPNN